MAHCLLITQRTPVQEREPRFVPHVRPCGRIVSKSRLKWSMAWWKGAGFYHYRFVDHWILTGGIDRFSIAYSSGFIVRISVRANPDDRVVVDEVLISGRVVPSIRFFVASFFLMTAWNVVVEFLNRVVKIVIVHHSSYCWAGCSRSSSCAALLIQIVIVCRCEWWCSEQELHARRKLLVVDPRCHKFTRMILSASLYLTRLCRRLIVRYLEYDQRERKLARSSSCEHKTRRFRLVRALAWSNSPTSSIDVLCYWDWFFSLSFGNFQVFSPGFSGCPRCGYIISIYSRGTVS
jgi:hypothetical protein